MQIATYRFAIPWRGTALRGRRQAPAALRKCAGGTFLAEAVAVALGNREGGTLGDGSPLPANVSLFFSVGPAALGGAIAHPPTP